MSLIIVLAVLLAVVTGVVLNSIDTPAIKRRKQAKQLERETGVARPQDAVPDKYSDEYTKRLEAEIFGVEKDISELPGYYWEVKLDKAGDFEISLMGKTHKAHQRRLVLQLKPNRYGNGTQKTEEELEAGFQHAFKTMVKAELDKLRNAEVQKRMLEKYNGKAVETK